MAKKIHERVSSIDRITNENWINGQIIERFSQKN